MSKSSISHSSMKSLFTAVFAMALCVTVSAQTYESGASNKDVDVRSSAGDLHMGSTADVKDLGLPIYPGARVKHEGDNKNSANLALFTSMFGMKLVVANYDSDESTTRLITYYRERLKKYGKVLECRTNRAAGDINVNEGDQDSHSSKELRCEDDQTGGVVELKVGTENNQHIVAIKPAENGKGSTFALVYVHTRGKQADI